MARLDRAAELYTRIKFLAVDVGEDSHTVAGFLAALEATHVVPILDESAAIPAQYRSAPGLPVTFFVDAGGTIVMINVGELDHAHLAAGIRAASNTPGAAEINPAPPTDY
jgi:hypothetical protein